MTGFLLGVLATIVAVVVVVVLMSRKEGPPDGPNKER